MKFKSKQDVIAFLLEIGKLESYLSELNTIDKDFKPDDKMLEFFINKRSKTFNFIRDRKKSFIMKSEWRKNPFKFLTGIRQFNKTIEAKRFHRSLGRFITTRFFMNKYKDRTLQAECFMVESNGLKAVSSLNTHLIIETEYYKDVVSHVNFMIMFEECITALDEINHKILKNKEITDNDLNLLGSFIPISELSKAISLYSTLDIEKITDYLSKVNRDEKTIVEILDDFKNGLV